MTPSTPYTRIGRLALAAVTALIGLVLMLLLLQPHSALEADSISVGLVTDGPTVDDGGFNWLSYQGLLRAESELGVTGNVYTSTSDEDYQPNLEQCVTDGNALCLSVGFLTTDAISNVAALHPETYFGIIDVSWDGMTDNLRGMIFAADQAGYLAGTLAGLMSESDLVGGIGGLPIPPVDAFLYPYRNGAQCANPEASALISYTNTFMDPDLGAEFAQAMIGQGADVIFAVAGPTGWGSLLTATQSAVWGIGVDVDQYYTVFMSGTITGSEKLLSSAIKRIDNAVFDTIGDVISGTFTSGETLYDLAVDGVGLAPFHEADPEVPQAVRDELAAVAAGIIDGSININETCRAPGIQVFLPLLVR
jgi:basic membrane lipoprotein Med (substrate-binding protein (PBP1-ABC) superfamily)